MGSRTRHYQPKYLPSPQRSGKDSRPYRFSIVLIQSNSIRFNQCIRILKIINIVIAQVIITLAIVCIAAFALIISAYPRSKRDVSADLADAADIAEREDKNVADAANDVASDVQETGNLIKEIKDAGSDPDKIKAALLDGEDVVENENQDVENFENSWKEDESDGYKLAEDVEAGSVPAGDVADAKEIVAVQSQADDDVDALEQGWDDLKEKAEDLAEDAESGKESGAQLLQGAEQLEEDEQSDGDKFLGAIEGVQSEADALAKKIES
ncbi:hypothetical protein ElyMa_004973300 [Elysia marginata]|uniref:Uncharacterized protein n=1 Tax=Elysia marginata TaxID=1093978 RepID=A0AAV4J630_9GAST|nr:hypothetical protein ElyMa_004973300 [Elysia marginata]